jgi:glucose dehydrogenase
MNVSVRRAASTLSAIVLLVVTMVSLRAQDITARDLLDGLANPSRWPTHSGDYAGRRFSPLTQITPASVGQLAAQWTFQTGVNNKFEATPIVIDGTLYVTGALNHAWARIGTAARTSCRPPSTRGGDCSS